MYISPKHVPMYFTKRKKSIICLDNYSFHFKMIDWQGRKLRKKYYFPVSKCVEIGRHQTGSDALVSPKKYTLRKFEWTSGLIYFAVHYQQKNVVKFGLNEHKNRN